MALDLVAGGYDRIQMGSGEVAIPGCIVMFLSRIQHKLLGIFGTVGEMGVHHGRFTSTLFITARKNEKLVVCDIFGQQFKNVDGSGNRNKEMFLEGMKVYGLSGENLHEIYEGSTSELPFDWSEEKNFEQFRIISVDAGHTAVLTKRDLEVAACNLLEGGIVVLNDFFHPHWTGVTEGAYQFLEESEPPNTLYPFLWCGNKVFFTNTMQFHKVYYNELLQEFRFDQNGSLYGGSNEYVMNGVNYLRCEESHFNRPVNDIWKDLIY